MSESRLPSPDASARHEGTGPAAFARGLLLLVTLMLAFTQYGHASALRSTSGDDLRGERQTAWARDRRWDPFLERICGFNQSIGVDFLNDEEAPPHALSITSGTLQPGGAASFQVFGMRSQGIYQDVTSFFRKTGYHSRALYVKVRPAPGSRSVAGKVRLYGNPLRIVYIPAKAMSADRTAILTFTLRCDSPLTTEFALKIPASR